MNTRTEGVLCLFNERKELIGIVRKDEESRKNIIYSTAEMGLDAIESLLGNKEK